MDQDTNRDRTPAHSCSDFTPRPVPYRVPASAWPVPYELTDEGRRALDEAGEL